MKWKGRPKSRNIKDNTNDTWNGRASQFINDSLSLASSNHKPSTKLGKKGNRKKSTGRLTGGGF